MILQPPMTRAQPPPNVRDLLLHHFYQGRDEVEKVHVVGREGGQRVGDVGALPQVNAEAKPC